MPKKNTKIEEVKKEKDIETKEILLDDEEKVIDPDIVIGDAISDDEDGDDEANLDDEELDPFKDKWEE